VVSNEVYASNPVYLHSSTDIEIREMKLNGAKGTTLLVRDCRRLSIVRTVVDGRRSPLTVLVPTHERGFHQQIPNSPGPPQSRTALLALAPGKQPPIPDKPDFASDFAAFLSLRSRNSVLLRTFVHAPLPPQRDGSLLKTGIVP